MIQIVADFLEDPGAPEGGAANHDGIYAIFVEGPLGIFGRGDVAIADDGDMDAGVAPDLADEGPVGRACVHLTARPAVDRQGLDAAVLKLFRELSDDELFVVPT